MFTPVFMYLTFWVGAFRGRWWWRNILGCVYNLFLLRLDSCMGAGAASPDWCEKRRAVLLMSEPLPNIAQYLAAAIRYLFG